MEDDTTLDVSTEEESTEEENSEETEGNIEAPEKSIAEIVNEAIQYQKKEGEWPELDPNLLYAAQAEKSRRDTQASYTKSRQELKALQSKEESLREKLEELSVHTLELSEEQQAELEELKWENPDDWRKKMAQIEKEQRKSLDKELAAIEEKANGMSELERRTAIFEDFQKSHPEIEITDEIIESNVPVKYVKQLEKGDITFEDFLETVYSILTKTKKVISKEVTKSPGLDKVRGGSTPSKAAAEEDILSSYKDETY